jgi:hypothetical protein
MQANETGQTKKRIPHSYSYLREKMQFKLYY